MTHRLATTRGDALCRTIEPLTRRVDEVQGRGLWEGGKGEESTVREVGRVWEIMELLVEVSQLCIPVTYTNDSPRRF